MSQAIQARIADVEIHILKADGGTMPIEASRHQPCETVFSGPAASTMGAVALSRDQKNSVVVDIGGTTTDISLVIAGDPLYASKGARIENHYTYRRFRGAIHSLGGDSVIRCRENSIKVSPIRVGPQPVWRKSRRYRCFQCLLQTGVMPGAPRNFAILRPGMSMDDLCFYGRNGY